MNEEYYNGPGLSISQAAHGELRARRLAPQAQGDIQHAVMSGSAALTDYENEFQRLDDYREGAQAMRMLRESRARHEGRLKEGLAAAPGTKLSLYRADGELDESKLEQLQFRAQDEEAQIRPKFWSPQRLARYEKEYQDFESTSRVHEQGLIRAHRLEAVRRAGEAALDEAEKAGDLQGYQAELRNQVEAGVLMEREARVKMMGYQQRQLRELARLADMGTPATINVGGTEYSGLSASLAMADARELGSEGDAISSPEIEQGGSFDAGRVLTLMPENEFGKVSDSFSNDFRLFVKPGKNGAEDVQCRTTAPECVQRVAAYGKAHGGIDADQARMMVSRISLDAVADNPMVTDSQLMSMFDNAGIYEAMGAGDVDVGKERCRAIVDEMVARGRGDTDKLATGAIKPMISAHLASREFAESREWGLVKTLNPRRKKDGDSWDSWDKSDMDEAERQRWFALYEVYGKYRKEFKPDAEGTLDKDEFEENAQAFHKWYMDEKYSELKRADEAAAEDWYLMRMATDLRAKVYADADKGAKYAGYSHDVQVAREVLRTMPPQNLGVDELVAASVQAQKQDALRSEAFRKAAAADYAKLRDLKQSEAANSEAAARKREREQAAEKRKAEKAAREEEKRAERAAARKLFVARSTPREAVWKWDGQNAPDGAQPGCLIPESEYKRLHEELGYDGSQLVYVYVNGARVLVTGVSKSGNIELNAPAVAKVQKKPNSRKGERWKTRGTLGYSYYFKSTEAK